MADHDPGEDPGEALDRAAILARRRRFIAVALTGLAGVGCRPATGLSEPSPTAPAEPVTPDLAPTDPGHDPAPATFVEAEPPLAPPEGCVWPGDELPPLPEPPPIPAELGTEQRRVEARERFQAAHAAYERGEYDEASVGFEHAYRLAPDLSELAYNVAEAAYRGGRWQRARRFYAEFLERGDPQRRPDQREQVVARIAEIDAIACSAQPQVPPEPCLKMVVDPGPDQPGPGGRRERRKGAKVERP